MVSTLADMGRKTVQVRIPEDLNNDVAIIAAAFGKSIPEYVEEVLRGSVAKDYAHAVAIAKKRAEATARPTKGKGGAE
jgi:hypothetical protein